MGEAALWGGLLAIAGAIVGSFLATVAIRAQRGESALAGRSRCDACAVPLGIVDLVPVAGYLIRRGRCRTCGAPIDARHLAIELGCVGIGALAGVAAGPLGVAGAVFGWLLLVLAALDAAELWLPDPLVAALALAGAVAAWWSPPDATARLIGGAGGFAALWLVGEGYARLRGREGLGGGDPKLFGAIGLWLGWRPLPAVLLLAALIGLGVVAVRGLAGERVGSGDAVPFGTFLAAAAYPGWLAMVAGTG